MKKFRIGNIHISATTPSSALNEISECAKKRKGGYICVSNLRMVMYANKNNSYKKLMDNSILNLPDGTPLTWCGKLWGLKNIAVTSGPKLFHAILSNGDKDLKHFLLGDTQEVIEEIKQKYQNEYGANIVGSISLPFCNVEDFDYKNISKVIKESNANIVWTAMRAPKQDQFNQNLNKFIPNIVSIGVGRAFRISIGKVKDAPKWGQKLGIAGLFTRKVSFLSALLWYIKSSFYLFYYMISILYLKFIGKKHYE